MKETRLLLVTLLGFMAIPIFSTDFALAYPGNLSVDSGWAQTAPTIDGSLGPNEWDDATTLTFAVSDGTATVHIMNDTGNL